MPFPRPLQRSAATLGLGLAVAASLAWPAAAGPALAPSGTNINPGESSITGFAFNDSLVFGRRSRR